MKHIAAAVLISALALPAAARERPTLWSLLDPNLIAQHILQTGVMAARSLADITYGGMSVDLALGWATITDVEIWPSPNHQGGYGCVVNIDRATLRIGAVDELEKARLAMELDGLAVAPSCLPPELRITTAALGIDGLTVPHVSLDLDYDIPSAAADIRLHVGLEHLATIELHVEFAYISLAATDFDDRGFTALIDGARLTLEDAGLYNIMRAWLPPQATNPETAGEFAKNIVAGALTELNSESFHGNGSLPLARGRAQRALISSSAEAWAEFVGNPRVLVLESGNPPRTFLDFREIEYDPWVLFDILEPRVTSTTAAARAAVPVDVLRAALEPDAHGVSPATRLAVGRALVTGVGAPRNPDAGLPLLTDLASAGDGEASLLIADALEFERPADAYLHALRAAAAGVDGAGRTLDRLEARLPFVTVLSIQNELTPLAADPIAALQSLPDIRGQALGRFSGEGITRSYAMAMMWGTVGAALGDALSSSVTERVEERVRLSADAPGLELWDELERRATDLATSVWIREDLPARHSGGK